jgi:16S rRNA (guanine527-N7)-methyltransferase
MFHVKHQGWTDRPVDLSEHQVILLERYEGLLREQAVPGRMIAAADAGRLHDRHVLDCLRGVEWLGVNDGSLLDIGSGAGLPGIVFAIARPVLEVTLVESRRSRAIFLRSAVASLGLERVRVVHGRIEQQQIEVDVCVARAFGSASRSWEAAAPHLGPMGRLIYWAGASFRPSDTPSDLRVDVVRAPALARSGPLVMMSRQ